MSTPQAVRDFGGGRAVSRIGYANRIMIRVVLKRDMHAAALTDRSRMLDGVGDQFVHDECERHCDVSADDEWIGIDHKRPGSIRAARYGCNLAAKIDEVPVEHHRSDVVIAVKLLVDSGDGGDARRGV